MNLVVRRAGREFFDRLGPPVSRLRRSSARSRKPSGGMRLRHRVSYPAMPASPFRGSRYKACRIPLPSRRGPEIVPERKPRARGKPPHFLSLESSCFLLSIPMPTRAGGNILILLWRGSDHAKRLARKAAYLHKLKAEAAGESGEML